MTEKWEYCVIRTEMGSSPSKMKRIINYFDIAAVGGLRKEMIGNFDVKTGSMDIDGTVIARLGNDGWELIAVDTAHDWFYFKRRMRD